MKTSESPSILLASTNLNVHSQRQRLPMLAHMISGLGADLVFICEIETGSENLLNRSLEGELDNFELRTVDCGDGRHAVGILAVGEICELIGDVEAIGPHGKKVPNFLRAMVKTPFGEATAVTLHADWPRSVTNIKHRRAQYAAVIQALSDSNLGFLGADLNSSPRVHHPLLRDAGLRRLTRVESTWPDPNGLETLPTFTRVFGTILHGLNNSVAYDAIYGRGDFAVIARSVRHTGVTDHAVVTATITA